MFYRFRNGVFIEADSFALAKIMLIAQIENEQEVDKRWHKCTCLGFNHRFGCPEQSTEIPF
jgi:hypothetical protein